MKKLFQIKITEKIKTHMFIFSNLFFETFTVYEAMFKSAEEPDFKKR